MSLDARNWCRTDYYPRRSTSCTTATPSGAPTQAGVVCVVESLRFIWLTLKMQGEHRLTSCGLPYDAASRCCGPCAKPTSTSDTPQPHQFLDLTSNISFLTRCCIGNLLLSSATEQIIQGFISVFFFFNACLYFILISFATLLYLACHMLTSAASIS